MNHPAGLDGPLRRHQRLTDHLPAKDPLPAHLRAAATENIDLDRLEVERREKRVHGGRLCRGSGHLLAPAVGSKGTMIYIDRDCIHKAKE